MVSATGTMFQVDCDYHNECLGTNLKQQRNLWVHFSTAIKNAVVKIFTDIQNIRWRNDERWVSIEHLQINHQITQE